MQKKNVRKGIILLWGASPPAGARAFGLIDTRFADVLV